MKIHIRRIRIGKKREVGKAYCQELDSWYASTARLLDARTNFVKVNDIREVNKIVRCLITGNFYKTRSMMYTAGRKRELVRKNKKLNKRIDGILIAQRYNPRYLKRQRVRKGLNCKLHPEIKEKIRRAYRFNHTDEEIRSMVTKMQKCLSKATLEDGSSLIEALPYCRNKKRVVEIIKECERENCIGVSNEG